MMLRKVVCLLRTARVAAVPLLLAGGARGASADDSDAGDRGVLFRDSFESGTMKATNEDGFKWAHNNRTSIVTAERVVWNNGPKDVPMPAGRNWEAKDGVHALRFHYAAGQEMAEQRFALGGAHPEIWMRFWLRVPDNYRHSEAGKNNKLFRIWMDDYDNVGSKAGMEFRPLGDDGDSRFYMKAGRPFGDTGSAPFIDASEDRGRWMQLVIHIKANSKPGAKDSVFQVWRRWADEETFAQTHNKTDFNIEYPEGGSRGFTHGYLMGWANGPYKENTEWLLDDFTVSTRSLLPDERQKQ